MGHLAAVIAGIVMVLGCGSERGNAPVSGSPKPLPSPSPARSPCIPSPEAIRAIERARSEDAAFTAIERARALDRACPSRDAAWQLGETLAYLWLPDDARVAYERSALGGTAAE